MMQRPTRFLGLLTMTTSCSCSRGSFQCHVALDRRRYRGEHRRPVVGHLSTPRSRHLTSRRRDLTGALAPETGPFAQVHEFERRSAQSRIQPRVVLEFFAYEHLHSYVPLLEETSCGQLTIAKCYMRPIRAAEVQNATAKPMLRLVRRLAIEHRVRDGNIQYRTGCFWQSKYYF